MGSFGKLTMGAVATFSLCASAGLANAQSMVGTWNCEGSQDGVAIRIEVRYEGDGSSVSSFAAAGETNGAQMMMEGRAQGRWTLEGNQLAEEIDDATINSLLIDGQLIPPEEIPGEIRQSMLEPTPPSTVVQLDEQALVTEDPDGSRLSCTRAG